MNSVNKMTKTVANTMGKSADRLLKHKYLNLLVVLLIALYAGMAAPALPNIVISAVDSTIGKLIFLFLIGFVASRNIQVALMVAVAFVVTLHVANSRATEQYINLRTTELFNGDIEKFQCTAASGAEIEAVDEGACNDASGNWEEPSTDSATRFTNFDPTAATFSNFEGFWNGAEGAEDTEGFDTQETHINDLTAQGPQHRDDCLALCSDANPSLSETALAACEDVCPPEQFTDTSADVEEFSVYPDSGSKYAYSLF
uniref:Uncharacterized protein n=1 Tax=viral metagenome TaxID=1070528 RepID=A0A6C0B421_9ZZZZ